jgi:hypothetical protein
MKTTIAALLLFTSLVPRSNNLAATLISTLPSTSDVSAFGESPSGPFPRAATIGQTITVPFDDNVLTSFRFAVNDLVIVGEEQVNPIHFDAFVSPWDGEKASGPPIFSSGPYSTTDGPGDDGFGREIFLIDTGELELTPGAQYVLFFSVSNRFDGIPDGGTLGASEDVYPGGELVSATNGNDLGALQTVPWGTFNNNPFDLAFTATFVPEPSSFMLASTAAIGLILLVLKRRKCQS